MTATKKKTESFGEKWGGPPLTMDMTPVLPYAITQWLNHGYDPCTTLCYYTVT